ncbi:unnamed protein product [Mycena citricolor]|uniref:Peptidase A1 domain-containing protein n=1 Tax=Mycena citricolor TaxID=2018698 RepID=A0AAD2H5R4_9AGAR|nr:unnamed protein product [Mycena citricolor]
MNVVMFFRAVVVFQILGVLRAASLRDPTTRLDIQRLVLVPIIGYRGLAAKEVLDETQILEEHVSRATGRLRMMLGSRESAIVTARHRFQRSSQSFSPWTRRNPDVLRMANPSTVHVDHDLKSATAGDDPPARESDSEVTPAQGTVYPHSAGLNIEGTDIGYLTGVEIGTPPRRFLMLVDSGSADMWVGAQNCHGDGGETCGDHPYLGPESSSSFSDSGRPWGISYGTGYVSGTLVTDNLNFAGFELRNHTFGVASNESSTFTVHDNPMDGVLGFAQQRLSTQDTPTFISSLYTQGLIEKRIVSFRLPRLSDNANDGEVTIGGMDPTKYQPLSMACVANVNQAGFWEASLDMIRIHGKDAKLTGRNCIFDTGTVSEIFNRPRFIDTLQTLLIAPKNDVDAIHALIPDARASANGWTVPCNTTVTISLQFGGKDFTMTPRDIAFSPVNSSKPDGMCSSAIAPGGVSEGPTHWLASFNPDNFLFSPI